VLLAVRPERLSLSRDLRPGSARARLAGAAYLGDRNQFHLMLEGSEAPVTVAAQSAAAPEGAPFGEGENLYVGCRPDAWVLLPAD